MKSLLVDALRQARSSRQSNTLSDSGSFDTTNTEFANTANDPVVDDVVASSEELALFETLTGFDRETDAFDDARSPDAEFDEPRVSSRQRRAGHADAEEGFESAREQPHSRVPAVAKFAPLVCIAAALVAALFWGLFQSSDLARDGIAMLDVPSRNAEGDGFANASQMGVAAERFPFIENEQRPEDRESAE